MLKPTTIEKQGLFGLKSNLEPFNAFIFINLLLTQQPPELCPDETQMLRTTSMVVEVAGQEFRDAKNSQA